MSSMMADFFKFCGLLRISKLYMHRYGQETANCEYLMFDFNFFLKHFFDHYLKKEACSSVQWFFTIFYSKLQFETRRLCYFRFFLLMFRPFKILRYCEKAPKKSPDLVRNRTSMCNRNLRVITYHAKLNEIGRFSNNNLLRSQNIWTLIGFKIVAIASSFELRAWSLRSFVFNRCCLLIEVEKWHACFRFFRGEVVVIQ